MDNNMDNRPRKITIGFVTQFYNPETGFCEEQEFTCGDDCVWDSAAGDAIDEPDDAKYQPYEMEQPNVSPPRGATWKCDDCNFVMPASDWTYEHMVKNGNPTCPVGPCDCDLTFSP